MPPQLEFEHAEKGCGLYALELALSLEKLNYDKLLELHNLLMSAEMQQRVTLLKVSY